MLDEEKHVLVVQQPNQVEGPKTSGTAQCQVSDHHGTDKGKKKEQYMQL